jgi:2-methylisocitrate lyase-like PEP mutase family enzyme
MKQAQALRSLLKAGTFLHMPSVYDGIGGRMVESLGFEVAYVGGFVVGGKLAVSEPLVTMTEQIGVAQEVANAITIPVIADAGAGFGEPLHVMRTVRDFIAAGIAGIHIEDQLFPKRAHYHADQVHEIPIADFVEKIRYACKQRDLSDPDFVIIARTDSCREFGLDEAAARLNAVMEAGPDLGLLFPRTLEEAERAPKVCKLPLLYVQGRGNRDGRPIISRQDLQRMGYAGCIESQIVLTTAFHFIREALSELRETGNYTGMTESHYAAARKDLEDLIGLERFYEIEQQTVEKNKNSSKEKS